MDFEVWKTKKGFSDKGGPLRFSLRQHKNVPPVSLDQYQFEGLFPGVDLEAVPLAPGTVTMTVEIRKKP